MSIQLLDIYTLQMWAVLPTFQRYRQPPSSLALRMEAASTSEALQHCPHLYKRKIAESIITVNLCRNLKPVISVGNFFSLSLFFFHLLFIPLILNSFIFCFLHDYLSSIIVMKLKSARMHLVASHVFLPTCNNLEAT
jgi:hypothetical protein